ncbi:DUF5412 domain-containing protein [Halobacillus salinarum]|uniref:DUF5412 domain-containing protein n=1 Tax=Halobacillus salinarum TaxID=2932257 RepID=A0ABY4EL47_9BACI|nr:DUF5412 family protein [Halobacillus salinarum]UOQ44884.1 DUF5412 domain-containing protein [Halobacillus salinarum]
MVKNYNLWSFYFCFFLLALSLYSLFATVNQIWLLSPPIFVIWLLAVTTFIFGIIGFKDIRKRARLRSWLTVFISFLLSAFLLLGIAVNTFAKDEIVTTHSPNSKYTINFYTMNGGAATSISTMGVLDGPLWFRKYIYKDNNMQKADIEWGSNYIVNINNHTLNLNKGETYSDD